MAVVVTSMHTKKKHTNRTVKTRGYKRRFDKNRDAAERVDVLESCTRANKRKVELFRANECDVFFAPPLKEVPMECKNVVLSEPLIKYHSVSCSTFEKSTRKQYNDNLCLFRALTLHLHGNYKPEEETSKMLAAYLHNMEDVDAAKFPGVRMNDIPTLEDLTKTNIFL